MGIDTQNAYSHIAIQEMSAVRSSFCFLKLSDFFVRTAKTLSICLLLYPNSTTNLKIISETSNTLRGTLFGENKKIAFRFQAKGIFTELYLFTLQLLVALCEQYAAVGWLAGKDTFALLWLGVNRNTADSSLCCILYSLLGLWCAIPVC